MRDLELFIDMDATVYGLNELITSIYNKEYNDNKTNTSYWFEDLDKAPREYFEKLLYQKDIFLDGECIGNSKEIINKLHNEGFSIKFITCPQFTGTCFVEKCEWLTKTFEWIDLAKDIICTGNKGLLANPNRVLIDDDIKYIEQFTTNKGIAICYTQGWNKDYQGLRCDGWNEVYNLIHKMERGCLN